MPLSRDNQPIAFQWLQSTTEEVTCQSDFAGYNGVMGGFDDMETTYNFEFDSGRLCLDFVNTLGDRPVEEPREETLHAYADLVAWGEAAGIVAEDEAAQ